MVRIVITIEIQENVGKDVRRATGDIILPSHGLFHVTRRAVEEVAGATFGCASALTSCGGDVHEDRKV